MVVVALQGDQSKPRPALIVQSDEFDHLPAVTILPITGMLMPASPLVRLDIDATEQNGLRRRSQIMVDKMQSPLRATIGAVIGRLEDATMLAVNRALIVLLGMA